jgi:uncharacterized phosphosugar-binding protein
MSSPEYRMFALWKSRCTSTFGSAESFSATDSSSFAAASGIASDYILWNVTSVVVEELLARGITPGILKSANYPGGNDYNKTVVEPNYEKYGW